MRKFALFSLFLVLVVVAGCANKQQPADLVGPDVLGFDQDIPAEIEGTNDAMNVVLLPPAVIFYSPTAGEELLLTETNDSITIGLAPSQTLPLPIRCEVTFGMVGTCGDTGTGGLVGVFYLYGEKKFSWSPPRMDGELTLKAAVPGYPSTAITVSVKWALFASGPMVARRADTAQTVKARPGETVKLMEFTVHAPDNGMLEEYVINALTFQGEGKYRNLTQLNLRYTSPEGVTITASGALDSQGKISFVLPSGPLPVTGGVSLTLSGVIAKGAERGKTWVALNGIRAVGLVSGHVNTEVNTLSAVVYVVVPPRY